MRLLLIGNSFTNRNDMPGTITRLGAAADPPQAIETERVIANGMALKTHWTRGLALAAIQKSGWDYVSLQEQSTLPLKNRNKMHESIRIFDEAIRASGAKTLLYLTWARQHEFHRQDELTGAYLSIGREIGATIAPVGVAWKLILGGKSPVPLHDKDKSHPNAAGSYLAACVFYATLTGKTPVGLPANFPGLASLEGGLIRKLQEAARDAVRECGPSAA